MYIPAMNRLFAPLLETSRKSLRWFDLGRCKNAGAMLLLCAFTAVASRAQTFTTLADFNYGNGGQPYLMSLVQGLDGDFYGVTPVGGANGPYGTIFRITPQGTLTVLHSFAGSDGAFATAGLIQTTNGTSYGTTETGGDKFSGTAFKFSPGGTLTTLHSFCAQINCVDGEQPDAPLIQASTGSLYGTTQLGGANSHGTIFKVTRRGTVSTLYSFCALPGCVDGGGTNAPLVQATNGSLYGTSYTTFFKINAAGKLTTLHTFGDTEGHAIVGGLIQATDGNFYGTASSGGPTGRNAGTVFKITPRGVLTTLHSFDITDGVSPYAGLVQGPDGNFYGTTFLGGANSSGTLFRISPVGDFATLYNFCAQTGCSDGSRPSGGLLLGTNGILYGSTWGGGTFNEGTIFSLDVGLSPFVRTLPSTGKIGTNVVILGTNLTGATGVSFNGTPAAFTVVSSSELKTTVPAGATTGKVVVTTPAGALASIDSFRAKK